MKKKIVSVILFIIMFITILSIIILNPLRDLDEIWNYNFANNISKGLIPYRDFNMLQMPLLPFLCGIFLKLIANELIIMRILAALLCASILFVAYKLFDLINVKEEIALIFTFGIGDLLKDIFCIDYNFATLLVVLLIIYKEIKEYKKDNIFLKANIKCDLLLGVLAGLTITLKQTSGLFICCALLGNKLLFIRNKEDFKVYLKSFTYRIIGVLIPIIILLGYLIFNNAVNDFINYTIKGISEFSNYISYKGLIKPNIIGVLSILVPITFIYVWFKTVIKEKEKVEYFLLVYGMAIFVLAFPISNNIHFLIGAFPAIILILYELYNIFNILYNKILNKRKTIKRILNKIFMYVLIFLNAVIILISLVHAVKNFNKYIYKENHSNLKHYKYIVINKNLEKQIKEVDDYIQNSKKNIKIVEASAATYMIPIDRYNKDYDMLLKGNIGRNGEEKLIQDIKNSKQTQYLILKEEYQQNWQTPLEIIDYIKENKEKVGEIQIFDIYE